MPKVGDQITSSEGLVPGDWVRFQVGDLIWPRCVVQRINAPYFSIGMAGWLATCDLWMRETEFKYAEITYLGRGRRRYWRHLLWPLMLWPLFIVPFSFPRTKPSCVSRVWSRVKNYFNLNSGLKENQNVQ